jgi:hypothetical protein
MRSNFSPCNGFFLFFLMRPWIKVLIVQDGQVQFGIVCLIRLSHVCLASSDGRGDVENRKVPNGALHIYPILVQKLPRN